MDKITYQVELQLHPLQCFRGRKIGAGERDPGRWRASACGAWGSGTGWQFQETSVRIPAGLTPIISMCGDCWELTYSKYML